MIKIGKNFRICAVLLSAMVLVSACSSTGQSRKNPGKNLATSSAKGFEARRVNQVVVMPLEADDRSLSDSELSGLTQDLIEALQIETTITLLNFGDRNKIDAALKATEKKAVSQRERAIEFGRSVDAQGVVYGYVDKFGSYTSDTSQKKVGAGAAFKLWLVEPREGRTLWEGAYSDQNVSVTENLFQAQQALSGGIRGRSPREIMKEGFKFVAKDLENKREGAFVGGAIEKQISDVPSQGAFE